MRPWTGGGHIMGWVRGMATSGVNDLELALARRTRQVAALSLTAQAVAGSLDSGVIARIGLTQACALTGMDAGELLVWDDEREALTFLAHTGAAPEAFAARTEFHAGEGIPGRVLREGRIVHVSPREDGVDLARPGLVAAGFHRLDCIPLRGENAVAGVMTLAAFEPSPLDAETEDLLLGLGGLIGTALDRARLYEREQRLRTRLERLNESTLAIAGELSLPVLLQRITDIARELTGTRYAALGVAGQDGRLEQFITSGISDEQRRLIGPIPQGHGLIGVILRGQKPVRVPDIATYPGAHGFPPHHPPMHTFLGAPITLRGRNLGNLYLTDKEGEAAFTVQDESLIVLLAAHAAIAIENASLYGTASASLQRRVDELREAYDRLNLLSSLAITAQEEERRRLARELHDDTAQALASVLVHLRVLERTDDPAQFRDRLGDFRLLVQRALDDVRRMALDLRPSTLDDLGLVPALESVLRETGERWGLRTAFSCQGLSRRLSPRAELMVYRIVQEALNNIVKHANATEVSVNAGQTNGTLTVTVRDNGRGFDVAGALASRERGLGLFGMEERAALAGGSVRVQSDLGSGTVVTAIIPTSDEPRPAGGR